MYVNRVKKHALFVVMSTMMLTSAAYAEGLTGASPSDAALAQYRFERNGDAIEASAYDAAGNVRAVASWRPTAGIVVVAVEGDDAVAGKLNRYADNGSIGLSEEEQLKVWLQLAHQHRLRSGRLEFAPESSVDLGSSTNLQARANTYQPKGSFDRASGRLVSGTTSFFVRVEGWSCDRDDFGLGVPVHVYARTTLNGVQQRLKALDTSNSTSRTSLTRNDIRTSCGNVADHGFNFEARNTCRLQSSGESASTVIAVFGININSSGQIGGTNPTLGAKRINGIVCN
jgi:hypothetical protein